MVVEESAHKVTGAGTAAPVINSRFTVLTYTVPGIHDVEPKVKDRDTIIDVFEAVSIQV